MQKSCDERERALKADRTLSHSPHQCAMSIELIRPAVNECYNSKSKPTYLFISDVLQCITDHTDAHVDQVRASHIKHVLGELLTIFVNLLQDGRNNTYENH